jgi:hypothetical protein
VRVRGYLADLDLLACDRIEEVRMPGGGAIEAGHPHPAAVGRLRLRKHRRVTAVHRVGGTVALALPRQVEHQRAREGGQEHQMDLARDAGRVRGDAVARPLVVREQLRQRLQLPPAVARKKPSGQADLRRAGQFRRLLPRHAAP